MQNNSNLQYGVTYGCFGSRHVAAPYAHLDDSTHQTLQEAIDEAMGFFGEGGWGDGEDNTRLLGIFSVDMETGDQKQIYNRKELLAYLNVLQEMEYREDADEETYGSYYDQHRLRMEDVVEVRR